MSLFTTREWWGVTPGSSEQFGGGCMAIGNLDNAPDGALKVATGSFSGVLRLYSPTENVFRVEHLMLEATLDAPILQLSAGQLLSDSSRVALAVLHPRALVVYSVSSVASAPGSKDASYFKLAKAYEHPLERPACNFCTGAFGGTYGHALLCVQSMDGLLSIFEQGRLLFERKLSRFLLPGPLVYCAKGDLLLTYSSRMEVEAYKYGSNIAAGGSAAHVEGGSGASARKTSADHHLIVGEEVVCIEVGRYSRALAASSVDILIIAAHTMIACRDNLQIRTQRRIDYAPLCAATYPSASTEPGAPEHHILIATQGGVLLVYRDMELLWTARLSHPATALRIGAFGGVAGLILSLGHDGALTLSYLGTDPPSSHVASEAKELNYEAMDEEHRRLLQVIRDASSDTKVEPTEIISLRAQVPATVEQGDGEDGVVSVLTVRLFVSYTGGATLENVTLVASCTPPLFLTADTVVLPSLAGGNRTPTIVPFTFRARSNELPVTLAAAVVATYNAPTGEPRCARCDMTLPLPMVSEPVPPQKSAAFKITLETNRPPPPVGSLFEDVLSKQPALLQAAASGNVNAVSIQYHCGLDATILVSKNSGRYRIQSSSFEGLWLLADELVRRLVAYHSQPQQQVAGEEAFAVLYAEPLPLQEYFELIDDHLRCRAELDASQEQLAARAQQFRVVEKRLLVRLKDRNPAPMANLELLFEGTYQQLLQLADTCAAAQDTLAFQRARLAAGTRLLLLLLRLRFALSPEDVATLEAHLSPLVEETADLGWEERTDAAVTHLLKTALAKDKDPGKDARASSQSTLTRPADAGKLKKHITLVADRLHKGLRPTREKVEERGAPAAGASGPASPISPPQTVS